MAPIDREILLKSLRPLHLITAAGSYLLGSGAASYLGEQIQANMLWTGWLWLMFILVGFFSLGDYLKTPFDSGLFLRIANNIPGEEQKDAESSTVLLYLALASLAAGAVLSVVIGRLPGFSPAAGLIMMGIFAAAASLVVPGVHLAASGFGELFTSILLVLLPPALGLLLVMEEYHRLLALSVFPLIPLHLSLILVLQLPGHGKDLYSRNTNFLTRVGWIRAVNIHNLLVLSGFLLFGVVMLFGFPARTILIALAVLPLGFFLIWHLSRLREGAIPNWSLIFLLSGSIFFLPLYIITYSFWF